MAIDAKCPFCEKDYRLKDDLVGKKVTCANQGCRKVFTVTPSVNGTTNGSAHAPAPVTVSKPSPGPAVPTQSAPKSRPPIDVETAAATALNDDPDEVPEDQKTITMACTMCDHKWPVAWSMQGKNVLCPDCKHRQKVPLQEKGKKGGWREQNAPEGVKQEKLEGVIGSRDNKMVSGDTLRATGVIKEEFDALPSSIYVKWVAIIGIPLLLLAGGVVYWINVRTTTGETKVVENFDKSLEAEEMTQLPLYPAALRIALGEYEARNRNQLKDGQQKDVNPRDKAIEYFRGALANLNAAPRAADREQLYGELAIALLNLGGEGEDLIEKRKLSWLPPQQTATSRAKVKPNAAELEGVQGQLRRVLNGLKDAKAEFDERTALLRRLSRELLKVNQIEVVRSALPALFSDAEQYEAEAQIGLECFRANKQDTAREIGEKLKKSLSGTPNPPPSPTPASAQALWNVLEIKGPGLVPAPSGEPSDASRWAYTAINLLKGNRDEARKIANSGTDVRATVPRLKALALAAEWTDKPGEFLDAAERAMKAVRGDPNVSLPESLLLHLAQMSARAGAAEQADEFTKSISGDLKVFAKAEVLRNKLAANPGQQPKDEDAELPAEPDAKNLKLGHAWGRLALARHNGARTRDKGLASTYAKSWPAKIIAPFGQIGVLLGIQDAEKR
ncbi:hypothetical protein [Limnoglobus roseus]|uniref:Uncharacterized protein n=1 Tax=Limnoglobus roseus TaxID=2598579 RepID=A0A5C1AS73_9BACT|nr:hypothetical protein [Limnoglobus roseus]QEL19738.1 hypothetical protein PX52LOC_06817 [Limnoglobus roseus]